MDFPKNFISISCFFYGKRTDYTKRGFNWKDVKF